MNVKLQTGKLKNEAEKEDLKSFIEFNGELSDIGNKIIILYLSESYGKQRAHCYYKILQNLSEFEKYNNLYLKEFWTMRRSSLIE